LEAALTLLRALLRDAVAGGSRIHAPGGHLLPSIIADGWQPECGGALFAAAICYPSTPLTGFFAHL